MIETSSDSRSSAARTSAGMASQTRCLRGAPAALAGDELVAAVALAHDHRHEHAECFDRSAQLVERAGGERAPRLVRVGPDAFERDLLQVALGRRRGDVGGRVVAEQRAQAAAEPAPRSHDASSRASDRYACAPRLRTSNKMAGLPYDGASESRMLRGICVWNTRSGK
jgi:hypothetical protein